METEVEDDVATECALCGREIDDNDSMYLDGKGDVCVYCYDQEIDVCQICGEDAQKPDVSEFILVKEELANQNPPGIYRIASYPFLSIPLIGSTTLWDHDVIFVDKLPKLDHEYEISGHICRTCALPFQQTFEREFAIRDELRPLMEQYPGVDDELGRWMCVLRHDRPGFEIVHNHTRNVILRNPEMLKDLECDKVDRDNRGNCLPYANAERWNDLQKKFKLPGHLPTFHANIALQYRGVKVYHTGCLGYDRDWHWMTLRPEPCFRSTGMNTKLVFAPSGLPTWKHPDCHEIYSWFHENAAKRAIRKAIRLGILTQKGVRKNGRLVYCR